MELLRVQVPVTHTKLTNCGKLNGFSLMQYQCQRTYNGILMYFHYRVSCKMFRPLMCPSSRRYRKQPYKTD